MDKTELLRKIGNIVVAAEGFEPPSLKSLVESLVWDLCRQEVTRDEYREYIDESG